MIIVILSLINFIEFQIHVWLNYEVNLKGFWAHDFGKSFKQISNRFKDGAFTKLHRTRTQSIY